MMQSQGQRARILDRQKKIEQLYRELELLENEKDQKDDPVVKEEKEDG